MSHRSSDKSELALGPRFGRRGTGYILVLGAATLVAIIGVTGVGLVRVQRRALESSLASSQADLYARASVEMAVAYTVTIPSWRGLYYGDMLPRMPVKFDQGSCSFAITEPDGSNLNANWDNPVLITGTGVVGSIDKPTARRRVSVSAHQPPLAWLAGALQAVGNITVEGGKLTAVGGPVCTNATLTNRAEIHPDIEAYSVVDEGFIQGIVSLEVPEKLIPETPFNYYRTLPTTVTLPPSAVGENMDWVVLSPANNPYEPGHTSPDGLYYLNPLVDLTIRNARIMGTLVVDLHAGNKLTLDEGLIWEPARPDYPALIVRGDCEIRVYLDLAEAGSANFNPQHTPYNGFSNDTMDNTFPSKLKGLFHVVGSDSTLVIDNSPELTGILVADGAVTIQGHPKLTADPNLLLTPPIKYRMGHLVIDPGTWKPVVSSN